MQVDWNGQTHEFSRPILVSRLLDHFSLNRESHLVVVNGKLATEDQHIETGDRVRIVRVVSGG